MEYDILRDLDETERRRVLAATTRRKYSKGSALFYEGDPGEALHLIAKGRVGIKVSTPMGDVGMLTVLGPGESFGEQALLQETARRTATAVAIDAVETLTLDRDAFEELRRADASVDRILVQTLATQVRRLSRQVIEALYVPAEARIMRRLHDLAGVFDTGGDEVVIPLTQEDVASMAGTTRPTANRVLQSGVTDGFIRLERGRIIVLDRDRLERAGR